MTTIIRAKGANFKSSGLGFAPPVAQGLLAWNMLGGSLAETLKNWAPGASPAQPVVTGSAAYGNGYAEKLTLDTGVATASAATAGATIILFSNAVASASYLSGDAVSMLYPDGYANGPVRYGPRLSLDGNGGAPYSLFVNFGQWSGTAGAAGTELNALLVISSSGMAATTSMNMSVAKYDPAIKKASAIFQNAAVGQLSALGSAMGAGNFYDDRYISTVRLNMDIAKATGKKIGGYAIYDKALSADELAQVYFWGKGYFDRRGLTGL